VKEYTGPDNNSKYNEIGPGFFGKMGIPLIAGREFTDSDNAAAPKVAVVNEEFAKHFFDGRNPVGRHFSRKGGKNFAAEIAIVGLVKDSRYSSVRREPPPLFFTPWAQEDQVNYINFYVRSALPVAQMVQQVRGMMSRIDRNLPAMELRTLDDTIRQNIRNDRLILQLAGTFAGLATVLAMLGLYGVMAHSVTRRTHEIGIHMALGAAPARIRGMVLRELALILTIGLCLGISGSFLLVKYIKTQLYGVKAYDAMVIVGAAMVLTSTAAAAGWFPARRAARVSPLDALRYE
jgi:predicted permease